MFFHQLVGIDAEITDIVPERAQSNPGVLVKVPFAQLQKTAKGFEDLQVPVDGLSCKGI